VQLDQTIRIGDGLYAPDYQIDEHPVAQTIELPLDADSSQLSALSDIADGKSLVIEGPPGIGKSQTIANAIANAMEQGKTVLFVAEKLAALEVVHKRLTQVGLADFCLEQHHVLPRCLLPPRRRSHLRQG
jgi:primosomal protein N'